MVKRGGDKRENEIIYNNIVGTSLVAHTRDYLLYTFYLRVYSASAISR